ncbi:MAG: hypothetical protein WAU36_07480 [Cyclobacteriaceae bacterium]
MKIKLILLLGAIVLLGLLAQSVIPFTNDQAISYNLKQRGVCWVGGRQIVTEKEFEPLLRNNIDWISQTPFAWQSSADDPNIRMNTNNDRSWWGESDNGIATTTQLAKMSKIKTLLKPHLWVRNSWPGEIKMNDAKSWSEWFSNYQTFILHYAALAEENEIEIFCIGTELAIASTHEDEWRKLIQEIRKVYSGKLTYAANFNEEYEQVRFWDALDFIGIQAYFPLSKTNNPTTEEMASNWSSHVQSIEKVYKKYKKPVLFTEIGYKSTVDAAIEPWKWPQENKEAEPSDETQAKCYEAFFKAVWKKEWLAGTYFWKWYPHGQHSLQKIDFTPQGKLAEEIILKNFGDNYDQ